MFEEQWETGALSRYFIKINTPTFVWAKSYTSYTGPKYYGYMHFVSRCMRPMLKTKNVNFNLLTQDFHFLNVTDRQSGMFR